MLMTFQTLTLLYSANLTHGKRKICYFFHRMLTKKNWLNDKHFSTCRLISGKICINLFHFLLIFHFSVWRKTKKKHFRSSLELEFSSSSSSSILIPVVRYAPTHQSALMRWHMCDFYEIMRKCHLLRKHSRFIQSLQFIEGTQFFLLDSFCFHALTNWIIIIIHSTHMTFFFIYIFNSSRNINNCWRRSQGKRYLLLMTCGCIKKKSWRQNQIENVKK